MHLCGWRRPGQLAHLAVARPRARCLTFRGFAAGHPLAACPAGPPLNGL